MTIYQPRIQRVVAEQFDGTRASAQAIEALPGVSVKIASGDLYVSLSGRWAYVNIGSWVVRSRREIEIITDDDFQVLYEVAP
jgi:hypothetical protein